MDYVEREAMDETTNAVLEDDTVNVVDEDDDEDEDSDEDDSDFTK